MESVYRPRTLCSSKRSKGTPISNTFDPFVWDPPNPRRGGGAWVPPTPPHPTEGVVEVTEGLVSAKVRGGSPSFTQKLMLASRDKESLLEEALRLKRMLIDQAFYLKRDKVHASTVKIENRKLENDIKDMEMQTNMPSYKTSGATRVRAKLQGMKIRYEELQNICDGQHEEITHLRRDVRISHAREIEMERDVFVEEIAKLQKDVKRLKSLNSCKPGPGEGQP
ncbi:hypothetical protein SELMODRAFT_421103 [Selaginella moellendorffii]|uniref:Uncharacterized protein n=1 Tax=Selaginella moellendorffii TaxID=88036 RepID=D8SE60_SELML|nr:hypothetical protein SELMODRAFT_421103 [Selaginella moellendorffii]